MKTPKKTVTVKVGSVTVRIYYTPTGSRNRYTVSYHEGGRRVRKVFDDFNKAETEAQTIASKLASGQFAVLELSAADRESYVLAVRELAEFSIPLHIAAKEYASALRKLPSGASLNVAVEEYARRHKGDLGKKTIPEAVAEFVTDRQGAGLSKRYIEDLRAHLARFSECFRTSLDHVTASDMDRWLSSQKGGLRFRRNIRNSVVSFFRFCQQKGWLPREVKTEAELTTRPKDVATEPEILSPEQLRKLLECDNDEARLYFAVGAFTGVRAAELMRLKWEYFHFDTACLVLPREITKKRQRRIVPMVPSLVQWLQPLRKSSGPLFTRTTTRHIAYTPGRKILGVWPQNGLRHSYGSYRLALTNNPAQVSEEMGNSPTELKRSYAQIRTHDGRVVTSSLADAWFSVSPAYPENVVPLASAV